MRHSNSSVNVGKLCKRKWFYKYIEKRDVDSNWKPSSALKIGRIVDACLTSWKEDYSLMTMERVKSFGLEENASDEQIIKAAACLRAFYANFPRNRRIIASQFELRDESYLGYVDAIIVDDQTGLWFEADYKTASDFDPMIEIKLKNDQQVSLYLEHAGIIAFVLGLDMEKFGGFLYIEMSKSKQKMRLTPTKTKEAMTFDEFNALIKDSQYRETVILPTDINKDAVSGFYFHAKDLEKIKAIEDAPMCQQNCMAYHSPCEYYSACYGVEYQK